MKGLIVEVLKPARGDSSREGFSSYCDELTLVGPGIPEIFEVTPERPAVVLKLRWGIGGKMPQLPAGATGAAANPYVHAEPPFPAPEGERGWMYGGCAIYTSDSRFPFDYPVKLHDRAEVVEKRGRSTWSSSTTRTRCATLCSTKSRTRSWVRVTVTMPRGATKRSR